MTSNDIKHTARYQLSRFIQSEDSFKLDLDFKDIALLTTIFDFMDSGKEECCFVDQIKLAKISRVPRRTIIERLKKLIKFELLKKERKGYKNHYFIGDAIKKYVQSLHLVSATAAHSKCSSGTLYNNNYNNSYNNRHSANNKKPNALKQTAKEWGPGHTSWETLHKI